MPAVTLVFVQSREGNTGADNPEELGGGDTATIAGDVKWATASIQLPPKVSLNLVAQAASPESHPAARPSQAGPSAPLMSR